MRYGVIGTGAIGGYYGARLQEAGAEVHFLLHRDYDHVRQHGLVVRSIAGDLELKSVNAHASIETMPVCDVVLIALKTTQNHLLRSLLPPLVAPGSLVITLQNGLGVEADIAALVPESVAVAGGLCFICANKTAPGYIEHLDYGHINAGLYRGDQTHLETLAATLPLLNLVPDLALARWQKLVWNVPFNSLSVILGATTDQLMGNSTTRDLAYAIMQEVQIAAAHNGVAIATEFLTAMIEHTAAMKPYHTSMKLDFDARRPLEYEAIVGAPLRAAAQAPHMQMLYAQLRYLDAIHCHTAPGAS